MTDRCSQRLSSGERMLYSKMAVYLTSCASALPQLRHSRKKAACTLHERLRADKCPLRAQLTHALLFTKSSGLLTAECATEARFELIEQRKFETGALDAGFSCVRPMLR